MFSLGEQAQITSVNTIPTRYTVADRWLVIKERQLRPHDPTRDRSLQFFHSRPLSSRWIVGA